MDILSLTYWFLAAVAVVGAAMVVLTRDTVHSAMALVGVMLAIAGLFLINHQEFVAAIQVIVYAGAIMVLFLFVIMLLNMRDLETLPWTLRRVRYWGGLFAALLFVMIGVGGSLYGAEAGLYKVTPDAQYTVKEIATALLTKYVLPFELTSVLLLVAIVGAVIMARREPGEAIDDASAADVAGAPAKESR